MLHIQGLTALEHFRLRVSNKPEIVEEEIAPGLVCFSVMKGVATGDTYSDDWLRECRGITFSKMHGEVVGRPLHKFFNVNERLETQLDKLKWEDVQCVMDKRDGSMIHTVSDRQFKFDLGLKSKKVFDSDMAVRAYELLYAPDNWKLRVFSEIMIGAGNTVIYEFTSPNNRIVLGYPHDELRVLHVRKNYTGEYISREQLRELAALYGVHLVDEVNEFSSFEQMIEAAKTREGIEGWIVQFKNGEMVKIKTDWYMRRHRVMTYWRERDIVELIMNEQLDDVKSMFVSDGLDIQPILDIEAKYARVFGGLIAEVEEKYQAIKHLEPRHAAAVVKGDPMSGLVMARVNNKEPRYLHYFTHNMFKENFGLDTVGSLMKVEK
jgi:RNA ligase